MSLIIVANMNLSDKILKAAQVIATTNGKLDITKVVTLAVVTGGIVWGGVVFTEKNITKETKENVCTELQTKLNSPGSLGDKVKLLQARQELGCK